MQENILRDIFTFMPYLSGDEKSILFSNTKVISYEKGTIIHSGGNKCTGAIIVKSGSLRVYILSEEGREVTLYRLQGNEMCMLSASCILDAITFDIFVEAEENSECFILNERALFDLSEKNIYVKNFALEMAVHRFSDVMWAMQQILFMSIDKRLAIFLWDEAIKNNSDTIKLTHSQIAKYTGTAREVISRMLKHFVDDGIISTSRNEINIIDKQKLKSLTH